MYPTKTAILPALQAFYCTLLLLIAPFAAAQEQKPGVDPAEYIAYQGDVTLSQVEIDGAFSKLPEEERLRFIRDGGKVDQLIRTLLRRKVIAADAQQAGFDQDPVVVARLGLEAQRELAEAWMGKLLQEIPEADYEAMAREEFLANPKRYRSETVLDVSHILIGTTDRTNLEAKSLAADIEARLRKNPEVFDELVMQYSDDASKVNNAGRYREMRHGMMARPFEDAAFKLQEPGELSEPVLTSYGYHIIRLNGRSGNELRDYSEVKDEAIANARQRHRDIYRENYFRRILSDPVVVPAEAVEIMARRHFGEDLERAPGMTQ